MIEKAMIDRYNVRMEADAIMMFWSGGAKKKVNSPGMPSKR